MPATMTLELLKAAHLAPLKVLANDPDISKTSGVPYPCEDKTLQGWIEQNEAAPVRELTFVIHHAETVVGAASLKKINFSLQSAELAYWIGRPYWGRGMAQAAARQLSDYAFAELEFQRLHAHALRDNNPASHRILSSLGFEPDQTRAPLPVVERFAESFPGDVWIFYTLSHKQWRRQFHTSCC